MRAEEAAGIETFAGLRKRHQITICAAGPALGGAGQNPGPALSLSMTPVRCVTALVLRVAGVYF